MSSPTTKPPEPRAGRVPATSTDDFLGGRIAIVQPRRGHRAGSDAVFLAASVEARAGERVLDVGAGVGVAGLCLLARLPDLHVTAVEIDTELCRLAETNAARNGLAERFTVVNADLSSPGKVLAATGLKREAYDQILVNPPFYAEGSVRAAPDAGRAAAHVMRKEGLASWMRFCAAMAGPGAQITMIHRPDALGELLQLLAGRFGGVAVFPLFPKRDAPAARILVQARKGSKAGLSYLPGLVLHEGDGRYTDAAEAILRGGQALNLGVARKGKGRRLGG